MAAAKLWGSVSGKDVHLFTLRSEVLEVDVSSLGAALVAVRLKVRSMWIDVLLGYESLEQYPPLSGGKPNFCTTVGRCANRIAGGRFELDGQNFQLDVNNNGNHLHGGIDGFYNQVFSVANSSEKSVTLMLSEPDGAMGYPGKVDVSVTFEVREDQLHFYYSGVTDKPTLLSMTNHGYWNLKGQDAGDALDHSLMINSSRVTPTDENLLITGELRAVEGTVFDFRGDAHSLREAVANYGPIDMNFCLDRSPEDVASEILAARLIAPNGVTMEVWTDQPGLQVFTGQNIDPSNELWWKGKGTKWQKFGAVCLEPQLWPDAIHHSHFPSSVLRPGETYKQHSWHVFSVEAEEKESTSAWSCSIL